MSEIIDLSVVKEMIKQRREVAGVRFINQKGSIGTVLANLSSHGKRQAEMTCTTDGCTETHVREQSDWHQCSSCRSHGKGGVANKSTVNGGSVVDADGKRIVFMHILDTDDADTKQMKAQNNHNFNLLRDKNRNEEEMRRKKAKEDRKAQIEMEREERALKAEENRKKDMQKNADLIRQYAAKMGLPISKKTEEALDMIVK